MSCCRIDPQHRMDTEKKRKRKGNRHTQYTQHTIINRAQTSHHHTSHTASTTLPYGRCSRVELNRSRFNHLIDPIRFRLNDSCHSHDQMLMLMDQQRNVRGMMTTTDQIESSTETHSTVKDALYRDLSHHSLRGSRLSRLLSMAHQRQIGRHKPKQVGNTNQTSSLSSMSMCFSCVYCFLFVVCSCPSVAA